MKHNKILNLLTELRNANPIIKDIFLNGSCANLYFILKITSPHAEAYFNANHVITKIDGRFYDITGEVSDNGYMPIGKVLCKYSSDEAVKDGHMYDIDVKQEYQLKP